MTVALPTPCADKGFMSVQLPLSAALSQTALGNRKPKPRNGKQR